MPPVRRYKNDFKLLVLIGIMTSTAAFGEAKVPDCSVQHSVAAEARLGQSFSWSEAAAFYKAFKPCLDGGISEEFSNVLAMKLAERDGLGDFWQETKNQLPFRAEVSRRMQSECFSIVTAIAWVPTTET